MDYNIQPFSWTFLEPSKSNEGGHGWEAETGLEEEIFFSGSIGGFNEPRFFSVRSYTRKLKFIKRFRHLGKEFVDQQLHVALQV